MLLEWFKKKGLTFATCVFALVIVANVALVVYTSLLYKDRDNLDRRDELVRVYTDRLRTSAYNADIAAHRFFENHDRLTGEQYESSILVLRRSFDSLKYNLKKAAFDEMLIGRIATAVSSAIATHEHFLELGGSGDSTWIETNFAQLPSSFAATDRQLNYFGGIEANQLHRQQLSRNINILEFLQLCLLAGISILVILPVRLTKSREKLVRLNTEIDESNRKYVFDSKEEVDTGNEEEVKSRLFANLQRAADFIQQVASGNYSIRWEGITEKNREANRNNIAGELIRMREQMKKVKQEDEIRLWTTEGLSKFGEIIRKNQDNIQALGDNFISNLVKYLDAKIGALFILEEDETQTRFLELKACYAYERKKFITRKIGLGEGLVGQTYLEGKTVYLTDVPKEYMMITSSLGETTPGCLVVVPLVTNERVEGILELASLNELDPHRIEFLEKIGETLASSIVSVRSSEKTRELLSASQQQSEEVRAQEEEMRQNMEELEATQEQMSRQVAELNKLKEMLEEEKNLFSALMDNIPEAIYFKDTESKFIRVSKYLSSHFGKEVDELIGKSDFDFQDEVHAREALNDEKRIMASRKAKIDFVEKEILKDGSEHFVSTTKMPLINSRGQVTGTFGISRDVTQLKRAELTLLEKEKILSQLEVENQRKIAQLESALAAAEEKLETLKKK